MRPRKRTLIRQFGVAPHLVTPSNHYRPRSSHIVTGVSDWSRLPSAVQMVWRPTACNPDRHVYWVLGDRRALPWSVVIAKRRTAVYRFEGDRVAREYGHADGPSSIPYFRPRGSWLYPAEGHPDRAAGRPYYSISLRPRPPTGVRIRPVPRDEK
jgi:hypothetical protein